jgi:hypothetical protein
MIGKSALTSIVAFTLVACGGAEPAAKTPSKEEAGPKTIEEAQDQIDSARAAIEQTFAESAEPLGAAPADAGAAPDAATCGRQCTALSSMRRAVDALCRLTGDTENRCVNARRTADVSAARISSTSCKCQDG